MIHVDIIITGKSVELKYNKDIYSRRKE